MTTLKYNLNGVWLSTTVADPYTVGIMFKSYSTTKGISEVQVFLDGQLVIALEKSLNKTS